MSHLRVTLVQTALHWEDKQANLQQLDRKLADLAGQTDLIVLPEMFTTGFTMSASAMAEPMEGPTLEWMATHARRTGAVVTGSFIVEDAGRYFNRLVWMQPDGKTETYDKRHLFTLAGEQNYYTAGTRRLIVEWKGWRIHPLICYDLRFPVWSRNVEHYDLLIYVANFPARRRHAWNSLLIARAIENQSYTIGVNRVGNDGNDVYHSGESALIDYAGEAIFRAAQVEHVCTLMLSKDRQNEFRKKLHFLPDQDDFQLLNGS